MMQLELFDVMFFIQCSGGSGGGGALGAGAPPFASDYLFCFSYYVAS